MRDERATSSVRLAVGGTQMAALFTVGRAFLRVWRLLSACETLFAWLAAALLT